MARQNHGPLSRAKGKLGGVVYQQYEGMQISREYQPVVKNPQTNKQVENRAKFKLSSQIVAQFKNVISPRLGKLSIYERMRRGAAVNAIIKNISTATPSNPSALVSTVVSAINAKSMSSIDPVAITPGTAGVVNLVATSGNTVIYTICGYDAETGKFVYGETEKYTSDGSAKQVNYPTTRTCVLMAVALEATTEDGAASISNISVDNNSFSNAISRSIAAGDVNISDIESFYVQGA